MPEYSENYFEWLQEGARESAREVVPLVQEVVGARSVVDIGCGIGVWLSVFQEHGAEVIEGVDGPWVQRDRLCIPSASFTAVDLEQPLRLDRRFDLVVSLEVAEHLSEARAAGFVDDLTRLGDVVLFSAAIPGQGGEGHQNEQWADYWAALFRERNYVAVDFLRDALWQRETVDWWYVQNILIFVAEYALGDFSALQEAHEKGAGRPLNRAHPSQVRLLGERCRAAHERADDFLQWAEQLEELKAELEARVSELAAWGKDLQGIIAEYERFEPGRVSITQVFRSLPALAKYALAKQIETLRSRSTS